MPLIIIEMIVFGWVLIAFTWHKLEKNDKKKKIIFIVLGIVISYFITFLICKLSSIGINFEKKEIEDTIIQNLILVFIPINAIILMPYIAGVFSLYNTNKIEEKEVNNKIIKIIIIFSIVAVIELIFLRGIETGVVEYMKLLKSK